VQLREYLPNARGVAKNELLVQKRLCGELPQEKWQVSLACSSLNLSFVKREWWAAALGIKVCAVLYLVDAITSCHKRDKSCSLHQRASVPRACHSAAARVSA
jgi:hypothetical protein